MENQLRFYPYTPLALLDWAWCERADYKPNPKIRTGSTMDVKQFLALKNNIQLEGMRNPLIVTYSDRATPMNLHPNRRWLVDIGNNRSEALFQLGVTHAPCFMLGPKSVNWPAGDHKIIDPPQVLVFMRQHFMEVKVDTYKYNDLQWLICKELRDYMESAK
jgi:hypothetical protein